MDSVLNFHEEQLFFYVEKKIFTEIKIFFYFQQFVCHLLERDRERVCVSASCSVNVSASCSDWKVW